MTQSDPTDELRVALRDYLNVQARYHADHGRYPRHVVDLRVWLRYDEGHDGDVSVDVIEASYWGGYRATATTGDRPDIACTAVFVPPWAKDKRPTETPEVSCPGDADSTSLDALRRALEEHAAAQARYVERFGEFANDVDDLRMSLFRTSQRGASVHIVTVSPDGHSAIATHAKHRDVCGVRRGTAPPPLFDGAEDGELTCRSHTETSDPIDEPAGVLLGLFGKDGYRTLWIAFEGDSAVLLASGSGLLVPRDDGFWRFDVVEGDTTKTIVGDPQSQPLRRDTVMQAGAEDSLTITYVGPQYLAYVRQTIERQPWRGDSITMAYGGQGVVGRDFALVRPRSLVDSTAIEVLETETEADEYLGCRGSRLARTIVRNTRGSAGRWVFTGSPPSQGPLCEWSHRYTDIEPRRDVVDHQPVAIGLVRVAVSGAVDAVVSPTHNAIVALTYDSVHAIAISPNVIGPSRAVAAVTGAPGTVSIVMAEWAVGRHVERWTGEVTRLLGQ